MEDHNIKNYLFGTYTLGNYLINDRPHYISDHENGKYAIWYCLAYNDWVIEDVSYLGQCYAQAYANANTAPKCVQSVGYKWNWYVGGNWVNAGKSLKVSCLNYGMITISKELLICIESLFFSIKLIH